MRGGEVMADSDIGSSSNQPTVAAAVAGGVKQRSFHEMQRTEVKHLATPAAVAAAAVLGGGAGGEG